MQVKRILNDSAEFKEAVENSNSKDEKASNRAYSFVPQISPDKILLETYKSSTSEQVQVTTFSGCVSRKHGIPSVFLPLPLNRPVGLLD